ncbi:MAG: Asp-tRNA(Asn)/Glu-tRNA(Gln) amidotransferase subunit GatB [Bacillota bacterium]|nr:Asp-tRNA(Asn)/Glu-tRNA(Gln) amidotransferase subunit GatB [Bacillota bacterium]
MQEFETVIGLEVHVELLTKTKMFCGCSTAFGASPNTQVCPLCLGLPGGTVPELNRKAIEYTIKAAMALNCSITEEITFDRKNYFYADLPKGYQISQFFYPMGTGGYVEIHLNGSTKKIGIRQIHLEEDTGKLLHLGNIISSPYSRVDFNRAGVPLVEIVTDPEVRSAEEARLFLQKLRSILRYIEISDCKMEEGSMRCDANISLMPLGSKEFGNKTELKNMNSFRSVYKGIEYEVERQRNILLEGAEVTPQTRHWDESKGLTKAMRSKFVSADYRCFPDPAIPPFDPPQEWLEEIRESIPELPDSRFTRFVREYELPPYDAEVLTGSREMADFFDAVLTLYNEPKNVSNWIMSEFLRLLNSTNTEISECRIKPEDLGELLNLMDKEVISGKIAKGVFEEMFASGEKPEDIIKKKGLVQISDENTLSKIIDSVLEGNPSSVEDFHSGKNKAMGFLVGQVMKETKGKANPQLVNKLLKEKIEK